MLLFTSDRSGCPAVSAGKPGRRAHERPVRRRPGSDAARHCERLCQAAKVALSWPANPASSKGRTGDFESPNRGSNPCAGTDTYERSTIAGAVSGADSDRGRSAEYAAPFHRLDLARALAAGVVASLGAGDSRGARVALDALRGLVDAAEGEAAGERAEVLDLETERRKRVR
jgi:hypothetical protein